MNRNPIRTGAISLLAGFLVAAVATVSIARASESPQFQPSAPYQATFYYPWFKNAAVDGSWTGSTWSDSDAGGYHNPPANWFSNYLPDLAPASFDPSRELYSSNDYSTFQWQVSKMAEAKMEVSISSWWGAGHKTDIAYDRIVNDWMNRDDNPYPNLRWAPYYEREGTADPSVEEITADLQYLLDRYAGAPASLKVDGKPVIFVYAGADGRSMAERWDAANEAVGDAFYVVLKVFSGYRDLPTSIQPDSWHQYGPAVRESDQAPFSRSVSPGFWKSGESVRLARNLSDFEDAVARMAASDVEWKLVTTWNEWGEGSSVEPGTEVNQANGGSSATPRSGGEPFGNAYLDILSRHLAPLEAGAGTGPGDPSTTTPSTSQMESTTSTTSPASPSGPADSNPFVFAAAGDFGANSRTDASLQALEASGADFLIALGDLDYDETPTDAAWCDYVKQRTSVPFELIPGNHEAAGGPDGYIMNHASCLPDQFGSDGVYPAQYAFSYPESDPYARFIQISPNLQVEGQNYNYGDGTPYHSWLASQIDAAQAAGQWVIISMHENCLSTLKPCEIGEDLLNFLIEKRVDLILQGHDHGYYRYRQLSHGPGCSWVADGVFDADCVTAGQDDSRLNRGNGPIQVISANFGRSSRVVDNSSDNLRYQVTNHEDGIGPINGLTVFRVTRSSLSGLFMNTNPDGSYSDSFSIVSPGETAPTPTTTTTTTTTTIPSPTTTLVPTSDAPGTTPDGPVGQLGIVEDATVKARKVDKNYGAESVIEADGSSEKSALVKVQVPRDAGRVRLRLHVADPSPTGGEIYRVGNAWDEASVTWNNSPRQPISSSLSIGRVVRGEWLELDVTSLIDGDFGTISFRIDSSDPNGADYSSTESSEPPLLIIG